jgi:hypothetical protein
MKTWGAGGITPYIFSLSTRWKWVVSFTPRPLYPQGKSPWYPLDRRLGGPQIQSGCCGGEEMSCLGSKRIPWFSSRWPSHYRDLSWLHTSMYVNIKLCRGVKLLASVDISTRDTKWATHYGLHQYKVNCTGVQDFSWARWPQMEGHWKKGRY